MDTAANLFDLNAPAKETLAKLAAAGNWEAWRGALTLLAGIELDAAAAKAGAEAAEFEAVTVHDAYLDLAGLRTECERTANWLAKWLDRNVDCHSNGKPMQAYVVRDFPGGRETWVAVHTQYSCGD
jgi:hypothetical protein